MKDNENTTDLNMKEAEPAYNVRYTYADYLQWDDDVRRELIDGKTYLMASPSWRHQEIAVNLATLIKNFLKGKHCKVLLPTDTRLNAHTLDDTVVQPDLIIVCDHSILDKVSIKGVPEMVVEILSPSTASYDKNLKFNTYLKAGIREYWIVDLQDETLAVNILKDGNYITYAYKKEETVSVHVLEGCIIDLSDVFEE